MASEREIRKEIVRLFSEKRYSAYDIQLETGFPIKKIYHYIEDCENKTKRENKEKWARSQQ